MRFFDEFLKGLISSSNQDITNLAIEDILYSKYTIVKDWSGTFYYKIGTDLYHCEEGPACTWFTGNKYYFRDGLLHRYDGPAIEFADGRKKFYIHGVEVSELTSRR